MWVHKFVLLGVLIVPVRFAAADGRNPEQKTKKETTDAKAKKGALQEKKDPGKDLKLQAQNLKKLRTDAADDRKAGNRAGAWAADGDAHHAEKLIKKDKQLLKEGKRSK